MKRFVNALIVHHAGIVGNHARVGAPCAACYTFPMFEFIDERSIWLLAHVLSVVIGAGGAYLSDAMFLTSIRDERVSGTELRFLVLASRFVKAGYVALILTGIALVALNPAAYLDAPRFLAKMTIVAIIGVNGALFHLIHIPLLHSHANVSFALSARFAKQRNALLSSGAISSVSWTAVIVLGMLRAIPYDYWTIIGIYAAACAVAIGTALLLRDRLLPHRPAENPS